MGDIRYTQGVIEVVDTNPPSAGINNTQEITEIAELPHTDVQATQWVIEIAYISSPAINICSIGGIFMPNIPSTSQVINTCTII